MNTLEITFWASLFIIFYTYLGYGIVLILCVKIKELFFPTKKSDSIPFEPAVTLFVAAYNEKTYIHQKVENMLALDYPKNKMQILFITDGSDDGTPELLKQYPQVELMHEAKRGGKIGAINRGMAQVKNSIIIYSDANAMLNKEAVREIVKHFQNPTVGCVAGEKRVMTLSKDGASAAGEGIYWKYESLLKKFDYRLYSAVGAAGELFAIRKELHQEVEKDTLLDDFVISLRIAQRGFKIAYEPNAYASESASASIAEEMKRKVRISAGGLQSIVRLKSLFNVFKYGVLSFQFISHRVLRWTITPLLLLLLVPLNFLLSLRSNQVLYDYILIAQLGFYAFAMLGWFLESRKIKLKIVFVPFYFFFMNWCVFLGFFKFIKGGQSVLWEKAKRA